MNNETPIKSFLSELSMEGLVTDYILFSIVKIKILFLMNFGLSDYLSIALIIWLSTGKSLKVP